MAAAWILYAARKCRASHVAVILAVAALGAARYSLSDETYEANALHSYASDEYVEISGRLLASPGREPDRDVLLILVERLRDRGKELDVRGNLSLVVPFDPLRRDRLRLHAGDALSASVRLSPGSEFRNFGGFSYASYLKGRGVHRRAFAKSALLLQRTGTGLGPPLLAPVSRIRCALQKNLERLFPGPPGTDISPAGAILEALLLGEDGRMDADTVLSLQRTGLYHLFAISGGHIAIITFLLFSLFRAARLPRRPASLVLIVLLVFYTLLVEGSPSVVRATVMTLVFLVGRLLWKDVHVLNTISFSAFALLLANPFSLFDAGFRLTYAATLSIILFAPPMIRRLPRLPLGAAEMTALSISALLGVLPIIAASFNRITFASLVLNYGAIPLVGLIMGLGYVFLPLSAVFPGLAAPMAPLLRFLVEAFSRLSRLLDGAEFLSYRIPTPHGWTVIGYYAFLLLVLARPRFRAQRPLAAGAFALFAAILVLYPFSPSSGALRVTVIDVGQGDSILVEFPGRTRMLVDGGGFADSPFDVGEKVVSPFLWRKGIRRIDILVLTHPHPDHINGLVAVAGNFRVGEFWETGPPAETDARAALMKALPASAARRRIGRGFRRAVAGVLIEALHPGPVAGPGPPAAVNDRSLVLRISLGRAAFLLAGDIGAEAEREILETCGDIRSAVLKAPHHGSGSSSSAPFLARVRPADILISVGEGNRYGFPSPAVLERARAAGAAVLRTDFLGAVECSVDGKVFIFRTASGLSIRH